MYCVTIQMLSSCKLLLSKIEVVLLKFTLELYLFIYVVILFSLGWNQNQTK